MAELVKECEEKIGTDDWKEMAENPHLFNTKCFDLISDTVLPNSFYRLDIEQQKQCVFNMCLLRLFLSATIIENMIDDYSLEEFILVSERTILEMFINGFTGYLEEPSLFCVALSNFIRQHRDHIQKVEDLTGKNFNTVLVEEFANYIIKKITGE